MKDWTPQMRGLSPRLAAQSRPLLLLLVELDCLQIRPDVLDI